MIREADGSGYLIAAVEALAPALLADIRASGATARLVLNQFRLAHLGKALVPDGGSLVLAPDDSYESLVHLAVDPSASWPSARALHTLCRAEQAGLALARRGLLIPAVVSVKLSGAFERHVQARLDQAEWIPVHADEALAHCESAPLLRRVSEAQVPLENAARSRFVVFRETSTMREHLAILIGEPSGWRTPVPVRAHSACLTGDLFGSLRCDCGSQLQRSVARIGEQGGGILLYLAQEGRGTGLANKMRAYQIQDEGLDTVDADRALGFDEDERDYTVAREMLSDLGVRDIALLTNNPAKVAGLDQAPIRVVTHVSLFGALTPENRRYLSAKAVRTGHWLEDLLAESGAGREEASGSG